MKNVSERVRDPFDLNPPCRPFVPGYGDPNADFHVIGDYPGRHGGERTGIPFTESPAGTALQSALAAVGLIEEVGDEPKIRNLYLSYRYLCVQETPPTPAEYAEMERFFDAELRAITAHVLLPVGHGAIAHVLENYSPEPATDIDIDALHATELTSGAWIIIPVAEPADWTDEQQEALITTLQALLASDYRRESDLGRFIPGGDPYLVR